MLRQGILLRIRGTASRTQEGFRALRIITLGIRVPIAALLQMGVKKAFKDKALVAVHTGVSSDDGRAVFCNIKINNSSLLVLMFQLDSLTQHLSKSQKPA